MSDNIFQIKPCANPSTGLRNIADAIDCGDIVCDDVTVIIGTEVYQLGDMDDERAAESAIFNMTVGIQRLMKPIMDGIDD